MGKVVLLFDVNDPKSKSRTQQHFAKDTDINNILKKYERTGVLGDIGLSGRRPFFADLTLIGDFQTMVNQVTSASVAFQKLPAMIRDRFQNDPANLLAFLQDPKNLEEGRKLGLIKPLSPEEKAIEDQKKFDQLKKDQEKAPAA